MPGEIVEDGPGGGAEARKGPLGDVGARAFQVIEGPCKCGERVAFVRKGGVPPLPAGELDVLDKLARFSRGEPGERGTAGFVVDDERSASELVCELESVDVAERDADGSVEKVQGEQAIADFRRSCVFRTQDAEDEACEEVAFGHGWGRTRLTGRSVPCS